MAGVFARCLRVAALLHQTLWRQLTNTHTLVIRPSTDNTTKQAKRSAAKLKLKLKMKLKLTVTLKLKLKLKLTLNTETDRIDKII